jgi:hypothetical protein
LRSQIDVPETSPPLGTTRDEHPILKTAVTAVLMAVALYALTPMISATEGYDLIGAFVITPLIIVLTIPILRRQARREGDSKLMTFLVAALLLKLLGAILRYALVKDVYGGVSDAHSYDLAGRELAAKFHEGNFSLPHGGASGTEFIELLTGIIYTFIGPTIIGGYIFYSWLGFIGLFFFYRSYRIAVPEGRHRTYARFIFFLPSLLFWPSSIGKESWMMFAIGITAYGAANMLSGRSLRGFGIAGIGLWFAALPRPHIAAVIGISVAGAFVLRRPKPEHRHIAPLVKGASLVVVGAAAVFFVGQASSFLQSSQIDTSEGIGTALEQAADRSGKGSGEFSPPVITSPVKIPEAALTVLFRPTIVEAHNPQALIAATESTFLLFYVLFRLKWGLAALKLMRKRPYIAFAFLAMGFLIGAFSAIGNYGILSRERVQVIPFLLVLISVPPAAKRVEQEAKTATEAPTRAAIAPAPIGTGW